MSGTYRIVIVEDSAFLREAIKSLLSRNVEFDMVGEAKDGPEAIQCVERLKPHLVLIDLSMPRMMGWDAIREIKRRFPETKVLTLTVHKDEDFVLASLRAGADGYVLKDSTEAEVVEAIKNVLNGRSYIDSGISQKVIEGYIESREASKRPTPWDSLTPREREIVKLIGEGYKYMEIADYLCISPATVEKHRTNIARKLNLHNTAALVTLAFKKGLVEGQEVFEEKKACRQTPKRKR
ncbi:MAG: response regulator [Thermodesulfobacteriota bacterium]